MERKKKVCKTLQQMMAQDDVQAIKNHSFRTLPSHPTSFQLKDQHKSFIETTRKNVGYGILLYSFVFFFIQALQLID
jgi:hypothetical protein